jgi:hypothetical protein
MINAVHRELPLDLVGMLDAILQGEEKSPSDLALIHSARMCEVDEKSARSTLNLYFTESKKWLKEQKTEEWERTMREYHVPENIRSEIIKID